jgi:hypothetical protein
VARNPNVAYSGSGTVTRMLPETAVRTAPLWTNQLRFKWWFAPMEDGGTLRTRELDSESAQVYASYLQYFGAALKWVSATNAHCDRVDNWTFNALATFQHEAAPQSGLALSRKCHADAPPSGQQVIIKPRPLWFNKV